MLPKALRVVINEERIIFSCFAKREGTLSSAIDNFIRVMVFFAFVYLILYVEKESVLELTNNKEFELNLIFQMDIYKLALALFFTFNALLYFLPIIRFIFSNGGYFVGTPTRLIHYKKGTIKTYVWELFTDEIKTDVDSGDIVFTLKTGNFQGSKQPIFVPDKIEIISAENVSKIERVARERIRSLSYSAR
ncbi:hypothetical protein [Capnocytophaga cynodegmi]|uniref:DUF304 domain-containing protein n=1 Tax=Capnocytophaga cynodegmi TaxID=28189 RepID=A0A0B7HC73_9FLAO|nr:hypothetical protein [Capnocytophaga cynodegmi]CEN36159.1 conserved hypothetical protein [Capnocytophaga cynodegmi]CEN38579.1 conserved hypothetical protein [Capnocytophaga cynodegmi]